MASSSKIFIDSNFFIALFNPADNLHERAKTIAKRLQKKNPTVVISSGIFLEVVTVLSQKIDRPQAILAGKKLLQNPLVVINEELQNRSWQIFQEVSGKNISFVDCSTIAVMEYEGIPELLTFDTTDFHPLQKLYSISLYN